VRGDIVEFRIKARRRLSCRTESTNKSPDWLGRIERGEKGGKEASLSLMRAIYLGGPGGRTRDKGEYILFLTEVLVTAK